MCMSANHLCPCQFSEPALFGKESFEEPLHFTCFDISSYLIRPCSGIAWDYPLLSGSFVTLQTSVTFPSVVALSHWRDWLSCSSYGAHSTTSSFLLLLSELYPVLLYPYWAWGTRTVHNTQGKRGHWWPAGMSIPQTVTLPTVICFHSPEKNTQCS